MDSILIDAPLGDDIVRLCTARDSVSSLVAADPSLAPGDAWQKLYGSYRRPTAAGSSSSSSRSTTADAKTADLQRAAQCGSWGPTQPSRLFLEIYRDVLAIVEASPDRAMVSPSLLGSHGVAPLTAISTIPDIARHMANVIARAEHEVFLATNYWQDSVASGFLTAALRELDRRAGARGGPPVVVKLVYDRGSPRQLVDPHHLVGVAEYTGPNVRVPAPEELPHLDLQVMNYHQPLVGTFHAKFMVVDRRIALLQSNNIQDNDNLEMMVHFEGPIVDSFYDMALLSWNKKLEPPLPTLNSPAADMTSQSAESKPGASPPANTWLSNEEPQPKPQQQQQQQQAAELPQQPAAQEPAPSSSVNRTNEPTYEELTAAQTGEASSPDGGTGAPKRRPNVPNGPDAGTKAFLACGHQPLPSESIHILTTADPRLPEDTARHQVYDTDIRGEVARVQASVSATPGETQIQAVSRHLNHTVANLEADAPDCGAGDEMTPYILHAVDQPFPIAMVNRPPFGRPTHSAVVQPQNAAWLSALRHARKNVFIQTPTLNAEPLLPAILEACERGVDVICYVCLGYNDAGELLPRQGGTNDMVAHQLYKALSEAGRQHLHYFWYVAKDQTRPIPQLKKKRDCHIKLMIVDESIGIMGNGNQDTQSWYHSQEINVMLESPAVCRAWIDGLRRNQNTHLYGGLSKEEGLWRDHEGNTAEGAFGVDAGHFSWAKGIMGAINRVQGKGGF